MPEERLDRTTGIDIEDWEYPEAKRFSFKQPRNPVHFLAWDFAGQVCVVDMSGCGLVPRPRGVGPGYEARVVEILVAMSV